MHAVWPVLLLLVVPLAGCASEDEVTVSVDWDDAPQDATLGQPFTVSWALDGTEGMAEHTGLHYGTEAVPEPESPADYEESAGVKSNVDVPGTYSADVTLDEPGTYYFRAHVMRGDLSEWTDEVRVEVEGASLPPSADYEVTAEDVPDAVEPGETFTITIVVEGSPPFPTDHVGAHFGGTSTGTPSTDVYTTACAHRVGTVPGEFEVECEAPAEDGVIYLRGHLRITTAEGQRNWWAEEEHEIAVGAAPSPVGEEHAVTMRDVPLSFDPATVTVRPGDNITWSNPSTMFPHTATSEEAAWTFDSGNVAEGESFTLDVPADAEPGEYAYFCSYHRGAGMTGTIVVEAPA